MWSDEVWQSKWSQGWYQCLTEELKNSGVPLSGWKVSGRRTVARPNKEDMDFWTESGLTFAKSYATWRMANPQYKLWWTPDGIPANELGLFPEFGNVKVKAYIDRVFTVNGELVVVDLKSGNNMPEDVLQLAIYAAAVDLTYGVRPNLGAYWNARRGGLVAVEPLTEFPTDMVVELVQDFMKQVALKVRLPNPGRQCTWCEVASACPWSKSLVTTIKERA